MLYLKKLLRRASYLYQKFIFERRKQRIDNFIQNKLSLPKGTKEYTTNGINVSLNKQENLKKEKIEHNIRKIFKDSKSDLTVFMQFLRKKKVHIYKIENVDTLLKQINESAGFIPAKKGLTGLYLNFISNLFTNKKFVFCFESPDMFIFDPKNFDIYKVLYHFHRWYSYKMDLPGFEQNALQKFNRIYNKDNSSDDINTLSMAEIINIKNVIKRNNEACDFVVQIAKENEGSKKALRKLQSEKQVLL